MASTLKCNWKKIISAQETSLIPKERSSHSISIIGTTLYLFGGENVARIPIDSSMYSMEISENSPNFGIWNKIQVSNNVQPAPRIAHSQATIGNRIYIFGGRQGIDMGESSLNDLFYFDIETKTWTQIPGNDTFPAERSFHQMVSVGDNLFVFGGCGKSGRLSDLHEFDTATSKWIKHSNEFKLVDSNENTGKISGRGGATLIAAQNGDKIFLIAGFAGDSCQGTEQDEIFIFDLKTKSWKLQSQTLPTPRSVCISTKISHGKDKFIVIFGGEIDPSNRGHEGAGGFSNELFLINEDTLEIKIMSRKDFPDMDWPISRGWSSGSSISNEQFLIFGGLTGDDKDPMRLNDLWTCTIHE